MPRSAPGMEDTLPSVAGFAIDQSFTEIDYSAGLGCAIGTHGDIVVFFYLCSRSWDGRETGHVWKHLPLMPQRLLSESLLASFTMRSRPQQRTEHEAHRHSVMVPEPRRWRKGLGICYVCDEV